MATTDLIGEVEKRIGVFALEWHWTPAQVWALSFREFCTFVDIFDALADARKKANQRKPTRGRRRGK